MFQTSTPNSITGVGAIPSGSGSTSFFAAYGGSDPNNTHFLSMVSDSVHTFLESGVTGAGVAKPLIVYVGGAERLRIDASGNVLVNSPAGLGYGPGAGGAVTQSTSKSTSVTLNKPCGRITTHNAALAPGAQVTFNLNNSLIGVSDIVKVSTYDLGNAAPDAYEVRARTAAGIAVITIRNSGGATYSENIGILFQISKGATS